MWILIILIIVLQVLTVNLYPITIQPSHTLSSSHLISKVQEDIHTLYNSFASFDSEPVFYNVTAKPDIKLVYETPSSSQLIIKVQGDIHTLPFCILTCDLLE